MHLMRKFGMHYSPIKKEVQPNIYCVTYVKKYD